jgi:glycosyltransferase involved in cell wall biosynthesis
MKERYSIILPAKNEAASLTELLPELRNLLPNAEIIVVDDGSTDDTALVSAKYGAIVISRPISLGNGAAVKAGARAAHSESLIFMDADGQHQPRDIPRLLEMFEQGYDMVVGARTRQSQAGTHRAFANAGYNRLATWMTGRKIEDLTSGFRVVNADKFRKFLYLLPNGFSYPTTITMSFFRAGFLVGYVPVETRTRQGKSHIRLWRDGLRFLIIIFRTCTLYSPMRLFLPVSFMFFVTGVGYYLYTYLTQHRFTNMSALLFITSVLIFLIGLISEQITMLNYKDRE